MTHPPPSQEPHHARPPRLLPSRGIHRLTPALLRARPAEQAKGRDCPPPVAVPVNHATAKRVRWGPPPLPRPPPPPEQHSHTQSAPIPTSRRGPRWAVPGHFPARFALASCVCLTLRLPPPRPPGRPRRCLPATITHVATIGPLFVLRVRYVLRVRKQNGTERGLQRPQWSLPHPSPGDLAAVVKGFQGCLARWTPCLIDNKFPSLVARRQLRLCGGVSLPDNKKPQLWKTSHVRDYGCTSLQVRPVRASGSVARQCRYVVASDPLLLVQMPGLASNSQRQSVSFPPAVLRKTGRLAGGRSSARPVHARRESALRQAQGGFCDAF